MAVGKYDFWPLERYAEFDDYDLTEFKYYMFVPIIFWIFWKLRQYKTENGSEKTNDEI